jgi:hypothetical protein
MPHQLLVRLLATVLLLGGLVAEPVLTPASAQTQPTCRLLGSSGVDEALYEIDILTGNAKVVGNVGSPLTGLARDPKTGVLYGVTVGPPFQRDLLRIDPSTGAASTIAPISASIRAVPDITFRADGTLFGWVETADDLATISKETGTVTIVGDAGISTAGTGLAFTSDGALYLTGNQASGQLRRVEPATGLTTVVANLSNAPLPGEEMPALTGHPVTGALFGVNMDNATGESYLVTIDKKTGQIANHGQLPDFFEALVFYCSEVAGENNNDPNNDDEEQVTRRRRTRNNATRGQDESRTEGNVLGVRCKESDPVPPLTKGFIVDPDMLPYALIANRDEGAQKILLIRDAAKLCQYIQVGDYLEAEGEKQSEALFYADEVDIKKR